MARQANEQVAAVPACVVKCSLSNAIRQVTWSGPESVGTTCRSPQPYAVALCRTRETYLLARFVFFALRGLTLEAVDCLNLLPFLAFGTFTACVFLGAAWTIPVTPQLSARASANVRNCMIILLRTCGEPQVHF